jgi:hypothetical protein
MKKMIAKNESHEWERMVPYSRNSLCRYDNRSDSFRLIRAIGFIAQEISIEMVDPVHHVVGQERC